MGNGEFARYISELEERSVEGDLVFLKKDLIAETESGAPLWLTPGARERLAPFNIPKAWLATLKPKGFEFGLSLRSNLAQLGINLSEIEFDEERGQLSAVLDNLSLHTVYASRPLNLAKLVARGKPLTGNALETAIDTAGYMIDPNRTLNRETGTITVPVGTALEQKFVDPEAPIDLRELFTGTKRTELHEQIGIREKKTNGHGLDRPMHLAQTAGIVKTPEDHCLWIVDCEDESGIPVEHSESRLMYGGYRWSLITETFMPVAGGKLNMQAYRAFDYRQITAPSYY